MRRPGAAVRLQRGRHLLDAQAGQRSPHHHFAGELHSRGLEVQPADGFGVEAAQAAMEIAGADAEEQAAEIAEHRVAEITVQHRHGAGLDAAPETVAHHQLRPVAQARHEGVERAEIVAVVGVAHDDEAATGGGDAAQQGSSVTLLRDRHDARAHPARDLLRAVGAAVVGDQHLARDTGALEETLRLADAGGERLGLVEAGHQDGQFEPPAVGCTYGGDGVHGRIPQPCDARPLLERCTLARQALRKG